ncbi:MAG: hypothetical protein Q9M37_06095 [Desulfonauticus sp.]|nr:hypothetical protein [Desulfonauticus sp.]
MLDKLKYLFIIVYLGVRISLSELCIGLFGILTRIEEQQLLKQLNKEYLLLGINISRFKDLNHPEIQLSLEQIDFLKKEIEFLKKQHKNKIKTLLESRKENLLGLLAIRNL